MSYNENQKTAIKTQDKDILVSAGAGSGKTFVMIERIADNIINHRVSVDELLVVTFTNAAASEMRQKLNNKLYELLSDNKLDSNEKKYIFEQIDLMGQSDICTLHKFCQTVIQKYFYMINIDPSFGISEDSESVLLKDKAIENVFLKLTENGDDSFKLLTITFDDKRGFDKIKKNVYKVYEFLTNQPSIQAFKDKVFSNYTGLVEDNIFCNIINNYVAEFFEYYSNEFLNLSRESELLKYEPLTKNLKEYSNLLSKVNKDNDFKENHYLTYNLKLSNITSAKPDGIEQETLKEKVKDLKKDFSKRIGDIRKDVLISENFEDLQDSLDSSKDIVEAMFFVVDEFTKEYLKLKKERNLVDFSDLEHFAYQILQNPQVKQELQSKYKQIYVDEYQDVNDIQESIIQCIHNKCDLFLVGDVKQSIYGFRNTNPQIFLDKQKKFSLNDDDSVALFLNSNYRTDQKILDFVNYIFGALMHKASSGIEYLPDHKMVSGCDFVSNESFPQVEMLIVEKEKEEKEKIIPTQVYKVSTAQIQEDEEKSYAKAEANVIYSKIIELMQEEQKIFDPKIGENGDFREIQLKDITLLAQTRGEYLDILLKELSDLGLPIASISNDKLSEEYEIKLLFDYLNLVNNITDDIRLTSFLISPIINLNEDELALIRMNSDEDYFYKAVLNYNNEDKIKQKIDYALALIHFAREFLVNKTIYDLLIEFCDRTNYLELLESFEGGKSRVSNVLGYLNSFVGKKYNNDLSEYISSISTTGEFSLFPEVDVGISVIGVETMHKSKGLEYPIVFLVNTGHQFNSEDIRGDFLLNSEYGIGMQTYFAEKRYKKETLSHIAIKIAQRDKKFAESLRLLYVAMTRAKNHLYITGSIDPSKLTSSSMPFVLKSCNNFLSLVLSVLDKEELETLIFSKHLVKPLALHNDIHFSLIPCPKTFAQTEDNIQLETGDIDNKLKDKLNSNFNFVYPYAKSTTTALKNSVTILNKTSEPEGNTSYNVTPQQFSITENTVSVNTDVGIVYHKAMQYMDFSLETEQEISQFLKNKLTKEEFNLINCGKITQAVKNLQPLVSGAKLLRERQFLMRIPINELTTSDVKDEVLVQGVIDLIVIKNDKIYIVDYKTSNTKNVEKTAQNYKTQLKCYQKAVEGALGVKIAEKFLYFFLQEKLIII